MPFNKDFGPLNLAMTHRFCRELQKLLKIQMLSLRSMNSLSEKTSLTSTRQKITTATEALR